MRLTLHVAWGPQADVKKLKSAIERSGDIDFLLTCEWPMDVAQTSPLPAGVPASGVAF